MNDRLKFRVWNIKDEEYVEDQCDECHINFDGTLVAGAYCDDGYTGHWEQYHPHEVIIEQCTGLRDKNSNLIYESDVVQLSAEDNTFVSAVVVWQNGCFCPGDDEPFGDSSMWEIIGNIHEQK